MCINIFLLCVTIFTECTDTTLILGRNADPYVNSLVIYYGYHANSIIDYR